MKFWVVSSALLAGGGVAIVVSQGYFVINQSGGSSNIRGLYVGASIGFIGMGLLVQALGETLERFPSGVPGSEVAGLRRKAIGYSVGAAGLAFGEWITGDAGIGAVSGCLVVGGYWAVLGLMTGPWTSRLPQADVLRGRVSGITGGTARNTYRYRLRARFLMTYGTLPGII